jgi:HK97 family phage portal protein
MAGEYVDVQTALRSAAVAACRRVIVNSLLAMPAHSYKVLPGERGKLVRHDVDAQVVRAPSVRCSKRSWVAQVANGLVLYGNVYGLVTSRDRQGYPVSVEVLPDKAVTWSTDAQGVSRPWYGGQERKLWPLGDLVHQAASPWIMPGSPVAQSPVELAKESIGTGQAAERFGANFFRDGFHPTAVAYSDETLSPEDAAGIKASLLRMSRGNREPGVFGSGLKVEQLPVQSGDSQFVDLMRFETEQAARFFGVPPSMIYAAVSGQAVTYQNVADTDLQFLKHSLRSWVDDIEDMWSSLLPGPQTVRLTPEGLIRMDPKGRHDLYKTRLESKTITVNEVRELEDEPRFESAAGGNPFDVPGLPGAVVSGDEMSEDDTNDDPSD